jgi:hypothetical protein
MLLSAPAFSQTKAGVEKYMPVISGYAQMGYLNQHNQTVDKSTFQINRLRLILNGEINDIFDYKIQMEGWSNSHDSNDKSLISIQDMFLRAKISPELVLQVGQFPIPLSMENFDISPATLETVDFSSVVYNIVCKNPVTNFSHYGRDCGLMASGGFLHRDGFDILNYNLAVFNGSQMNQQDNNKSKDIVGRLTIRPVKNLRISGSFSTGESYFTAAERYAKLNKYVVGAWYKEPEGLMVRSEYGHIKCDDYTLDIDQNLFYATLGYNFKGKYMPILRYDTYEDSNIDDSRVNNYLMGFLWTPYKKLRVQANYTFSKYGDYFTDYINGNKLQLMVTVFF